MRGLHRLALWTCIGMLIVLLMGALVTKTDSGDECGNTWPLCNGKWVPAYTIGSMIEYSHRVVSGIVGLMVLAACIWVYRETKRKDARFYAAGALVFTVVQAALGAMAVVWSQSDLVMALHFGISLIAFAFTLLLVIAVRTLHLPAYADGWGERMDGMKPVKPGFRLLVWFTLFYTYVVVYLGAYVRHTESVSGCRGWPLCNGEWIPELSGEVGIAFLHRAASALLFVLVVWLALWGERHDKENRMLRTFGRWSLLLTAAQILSGGVMMLTLDSESWHLLTSLLHNTLVAGLFGVLSYMSFVVWRLGDATVDVYESQNVS